MALFALIVVCAAGWIVFVRPYLPLYEMEQVVSSHAGYRRTTLTHKEGTVISVPFQADGNYTGYENYWLQSFSDELPGLAYNFGVHVSPDGNVYLAENFASNEWFPAGVLFVDWVNAKQ